MEAPHNDIEVESEQRREGVAAHYYFTEALLGLAPVVGSTALNGHPITVEMAEGAEDILRDIRDTLASHIGATLEVEKQVTGKTLIHPDNWGRADAFIFDRGRKSLLIWEYKYGHRYVDAFRNWTLINYAIQILETYAIPTDEWPEWKISVTVAQPRNYHPDGPLREWYFGGDQLVGFMVALRDAAQRASVEGALLATGSHCRDCKARHECPALERAAMALVDYSGEQQSINLPPRALGLELTIVRAAIERLKARETGLEEHALGLVRGGADVFSWRAEYSYGREKFTVPAEQVIALGDNLGVDVRKPTATLTPAQCVKAGIDREVIKAFAEKPRGAMTLVPFNETDISRRSA